MEQEIKTKAVETLSQWIELCRPSQVKHKVAFWNARDIIGGKISVPEKIKTETIAFIETNCKPSHQKDLILQCLKGENVE
jgi:hypothetical protein